MDFCSPLSEISSVRSGTISSSFGGGAGTLSTGFKLTGGEVAFLTRSSKSDWACFLLEIIGFTAIDLLLLWNIYQELFRLIPHCTPRHTFHRGVGQFLHSQFQR